MWCLSPSKAPELDGNDCHAIGARTGRAMLSSMARLSLSRSGQAMDALLFPGTWLLLTGALARLTLANSSESSKLILEYLQTTCNGSFTSLVYTLIAYD